MKILLPLAVLGSLLATSALAETYEVQMLNKHPENAKQRMVFVPNFLQVELGDTVTFKSVDKGHNSQSIKGMIPEGGDVWKGKMNQDVSVTFTIEGLYGYKCLPHFGMGMVGMVQVGDDTSNLEAVKAKKAPPKSKAVFNAIYEQIEAE
ncbi:MAG: pseudoazurin [Robiginitomaculum sp.]|nr:MAG: pseudoazurin [Robiginitomaculum sp.]